MKTIYEKILISRFGVPRKGNKFPITKSITLGGMPLTSIIIYKTCIYVESEHRGGTYFKYLHEDVQKELYHMLCG